MTTKPNPLALDAAIPDKDGAIKFGGGAGDHATFTLNAYLDENSDEALRLLRLRGKRFKVVFVEDDV